MYDLKQSINDEKMAKTAAQSKQFGWAVTCCFYSALHLVNNYAIQQKEQERLLPYFYRKDPVHKEKHISSHTTRVLYISYVGEKLSNTIIKTAYKELLDESMNARYRKYIDCSVQEHFSIKGTKFAFTNLNEIKKALIC